MNGVVKWTMGLTTSLLLLSGVYAASRFAPTPANEAEALKQVDALPVMDGRNGFAHFWAVGRDVPDARIETLLEEDVRRFASTPVAPVASLHEGVLPYPDALQGYSSLAEDVPGDFFCSSLETGCLQKVRRHKDAYAAVAEQRAKLMAKIAALDRFDHFRSPYPARQDMPFLPYMFLLNDLTLQAHRFVAGDRDGAMEGVCRDASIARKLVSSTDHVVGNMMGVQITKAASELLVDMLSELPANHPLPAQCGQVFQPDGVFTGSICPMMLGEGRFMMTTIRQPSSDAQTRQRDRLREWLVDKEKTAARVAPIFTWTCSADAIATIVQDAPLSIPEERATWASRFSCVGNAGGCLIPDVEPAQYIEYLHRLQDAEARQRMIATWLWLRDHAQDRRPLARRLEERPMALKSPGRDIEADTQHQELRIRMYSARDAGTGWQLPTPGWMACPCPQ